MCGTVSPSNKTSCAATELRASLLTIIKSGAASTLDIVARIKKALPQVAKTLPPELEIRTLLDQSLFVRAAVQSVIKEASSPHV
jgi:multidrug efflux pump subunit AcrB